MSDVANRCIDIIAKSKGIPADTITLASPLTSVRRASPSVPITAPIPMAPIRNPKPREPRWNTSSAKTGISTSAGMPASVAAAINANTLRTAE